MNAVQSTTFAMKREDEETAASFLLSLRGSDRRATISPDPERGQSKQFLHGALRHKHAYEETYRPNIKSNFESPPVNVDYDDLIAGSCLVDSTDRELVPPTLFVAMAQMKPCTLSHADRVGSYKSREIGFTGMSCKFCGGQPGFGRFFPASIRSLAQTTTSQTIVKHISTKCHHVPSDIRKVVLDLQHYQITQEGVSSSRPRYGSRKIFFERIWSRLHGESQPELKEEPSSIESEITRKKDTKVAKRPSTFGDGGLSTSKKSKKAISDSITSVCHV